ncbi:MAG: FkbM family methyltransferase [Xanthomonadales bacterium]|nr:FkbM family methyltransferase [Xanthomonadales bacterium]
MKRLIGREPRIRTDLDLPMLKLGEWRVFTGLLRPGGIVYSLGVGEDIEFDRALIEHYRMEIYAFDPTPNSVDWLSRRALPPGFHFHPWAVADRDGVLYLFPRRKRDGSLSSTMFTLVEDCEGRTDGVEVPARTLDTIVRELGHIRIDVLKMDIEGAEYGVLEGLLASTLRPSQLLVEFHHRHAGLDPSQTVATVANLREAGYALADISSTGREFTFLFRPDLGNVSP